MTIFKVTPISADACGNQARGCPLFIEAQTLAEVEEYFKGGVFDYFEIMPLNIRTIQQLKDQRVFEGMMR